MEQMLEKIKNIKIIMSDIDGTLLNSDQIVLLETKKAIERVREKGIKFGLCTGRDLDSVKKLLKEWEIESLVDVIVGTGGSEVEDFTINYKETFFPLDENVIKEIIEHFKDMDLNFVVPYNGILYAPKDDRHIRLLAKEDRVPFEIVNFDEFLVSPKQKLMLMTDEENMPNVIERAKTFNSENYKSLPLKTAHVLYEYTDPRISKTYGLKQILEKNNCTFENLLTFGDADNDYDMTENAGLGIVMANGSEKTKSVADYITEDNNSNGIANFINKYFLK